VLDEHPDADAVVAKSFVRLRCDVTPLDATLTCQCAELTSPAVRPDRHSFPCWRAQAAGCPPPSHRPTRSRYIPFHRAVLGERKEGLAPPASDRRLPIEHVSDSVWSVATAPHQWRCLRAKVLRLQPR